MALLIAGWNLKGGTGKSATITNLGACLALRKGKVQVLLIDLAGQRTTSFNFGLEGQDPDVMDLLDGGAIAPLETGIKKLDLVPGNIALYRYRPPKSNTVAAALARLPDYQLVLIDCPPALDEATSQIVIACDRVLLPTLCQPAALKGVSEAVGLIRAEAPDKPIDVLRTWHESGLVLTRNADRLLAEAAEAMGFNLLKTAIPKNVRIAESFAHQQPIAQYDPRSAGAKAYKELAREVVKLWGVK